MKIISNKKWEELVNQKKQAVEIIQKLKVEKRVIAIENQNKIDELNNNIIQLEVIKKSKDNKIKELEEKLNFANKEIIDLKKNVRKVCNSKVESVSGKDTKKENKEIKNTTKKVVDNTNEEIEKKLQSALKDETSKLKVEPKKRGRKPKNEQ